MTGHEPWFGFERIPVVATGERQARITVDVLVTFVDPWGRASHSQVDLPRP